MSGKNQQGKMDVTQKNGTAVFNAPLHKHSAEAKTPSNLPSTINAGMCTSSNPIAAILTNSFLDFSSSNGTDLRKAGVGPGQRYCLEASSWKSAADKGIGEVPKVKLESTHESALKSVGLDTLKKWAAEQENQGHVIRPGQGKGGFVRESDQIGGKEPRA
ncbi:hypothetical protein J4E90_004954 [Alternaria incomplexa]|uniref:uncharacterized protein n=1 Tax=Alternaria incomplexa TaxID=1187928 RepID=UPI00221EF887|nr:uncharacterized protein J4E90_004954 [Alternaria incomplexa]KAI4914918.1 hypothetical protein J4E90_004954 [Alternaria incomplexa]